MKMQSMIYVANILLIAPINAVSLIVNTTNGYIEGYHATSGVLSWLGISYASPPINGLRYQRPQPLHYIPHTDVYNATTMPKSCPQNAYKWLGEFAGTEILNPKNEQSEDCLYLNIYAPTGYEQANLPVMVWIHGGLYQFGSTSLYYYNPYEIVEEQKIVVVTIQYRVGSMGFLYFGSGTSSSGNMGLYDQVAALEWIHNNIAQFGGSPDAITLVGENAGAHSVALHMVSPLSSNLFQAAILQSSGIWPDWWDSTDNILYERSVLLAKKAGCFSANVADMVSCLQNKTATELVPLENQLEEYKILLAQFGPVVDGDFIREHPKDILKVVYNGQAHPMMKDKVVLIGNNADEGIWPLMTILPHIYPLKELTSNEMSAVSKEEFETSLSKVLYKYNQTVINDIVAEYSEPETCPFYYFLALAKIAAKYYSVCDTELFAETWSNLGNNVYRYSYDHLWSNTVWPKYSGVKQGDEIQFLFGIPLRYPSMFTAEEVAFSRTIMSYWGNFIKHGSPTMHQQEPHWPKYTANTEWQFMKLTVESSVVMKNAFHEMCTDWKKESLAII